MDKHIQETFTYPSKAGQFCIQREEEEELQLPYPYLIPYKTKRGSNINTANAHKCKAWWWSCERAASHTFL